MVDFKHHYLIKAEVISSNGRISADEIADIFSNGTLYQALVLGDLTKPTIVFYSPRKLTEDKIVRDSKRKLKEADFNVCVLSFKSGLPSMIF